MRRVLTSVILGLLLASATLGCGEPPQGEPQGVAVSTSQPVPLDRIPEGVREVARQRLPGVAFEEARMIRSGGGLTYELRGRSSGGRTSTVKVSASGQVLAVQ
ncbi:MAG TPA: hypothetical protein VF590_08945 [Isosphaeraceae bacterium]|jgi:hypothetical protein